MVSPDAQAVRQYLQFEAETGQFDFSGDEGLLLFISAGITLMGVAGWFYPLVRVSGLIVPTGRRLALIALPLVALAGLYVVLKTLADPVWVQDRFDYTLLFMLTGSAWITLGLPTAALMGISPRHDVIASRNGAAGIAFGGYILGLMAVYAGANIGNGATVWTTVVPAAAASAVLLGIWIGVEIRANPAELVRIERDRAAGLRLGALLLAAGLVLGRAAAGDFYTWEGTWADLASYGWPALLLIPLGWATERLSHPTPERPVPDPTIYGFLPAALFLGAAIVYLVVLGWPEVAPRGEYAP